MDNEQILEQVGRLRSKPRVVPFDDPRAAAHRAVFSGGDRYPPAGVVFAADVADVQAVVRLAGAIGITLSVMPNAAGNGAQHAPRGRASLVLDLGRLNDIEDLNTDSGYALLGPGVSFDQLQRTLEARHAPYWIDADPNGANSISGSVAERALGFTPYGDHLLMQCGFELVTPNGEVMRTGMGALPGSDTWQLFKYNFGPYLDGLFSRSNFGIVTKVGLWLMPAPPAYRPFMLALPDLAAVGAAVEILRPMKIGMVVPNTVVISDGPADNALVVAAGGTPVEADRPWHLYGALYGLDDNVALTWDMVSAALGGIAGARVHTVESPPSHAAWPVRARQMRGEPVYRAFADKQPARLWFHASAPMETEAAEEMVAIVDQASAGSEFAPTREFLLTWRTMFLRVEIPYIDEQAATAFALSLTDRLATAGYAISHDCAALHAAVHLNHVAEPMKRLYGALGTALDPDGVLGNYDL